MHLLLLFLTFCFVQNLNMNLLKRVFLFTFSDVSAMLSSLYPFVFSRPNEPVLVCGSEVYQDVLFRETFPWLRGLCGHTGKIFKGLNYFALKWETPKSSNNTIIWLNLHYFYQNQKLNPHHVCHSADGPGCTSPVGYLLASAVICQKGGFPGTQRSRRHNQQRRYQLRRSTRDREEEKRRSQLCI